jgi:predicted ester cyclase
MIAQDTARLVGILYDAYNRRASDPQWLEQAMASYAQNCEVVSIPVGTSLHGPEGLKQFLLGWSTAFPDSQVEVTTLLATEDQAAVEFIGRGTNTGPLQGPAGEMAPTGRKVEVCFCQVHQVRNGKVVSLHQYYDAMGMMQQLGLIAPEE